MTRVDHPLIELRSVVKAYGSDRPLRVDALILGRAGRLVLEGFDAAAAEMLVHLVCGAALPDEGDVRIEGTLTRDVATDTEWLDTLDRFGLVSERAVLVDELPVQANLAMPLTLSLDVLAPEIEARVAAIASDVGLPSDRLGIETRALGPADRLRVRLGRAIVTRPRLLLLEHPTAGLATESDRVAFGHLIRTAADRHGFGWMAVSNDRAFAGASGGTTRRLDPGSGALGTPVRDRGWWNRLWPWQSGSR
jgi:ABC-type transporter Mla maintaining outer membrane lipid asymmetry ATPase subunit MlaF